MDLIFVGSKKGAQKMISIEGVEDFVMRLNNCITAKEWSNKIIIIMNNHNHRKDQAPIKLISRLINFRP